MDWPKDKCEGCKFYFECSIRQWALPLEWCQYEPKENRLTNKEEE